SLVPQDRWFFVAGCQRSGTTLLRLILECHPAVFCFDELDSYRVLSTRSYAEPIVKYLVGFKIPRWAEQIDAEVLRDFGEPATARKIYNGQKIIFITRDYRDVIVSMLNLRGEVSWLEEWAVPIIADKIHQVPGFKERWCREIT